MSEDYSSPESSDGETVEGMPFSMHDINKDDLILEDASFARGAFGRMVKADYFGVTVCVKILKKQRKKELAKFVQREMAALKTLSHPNLVQFIGLTERANELYLITEYISGGTLRKLLKDRSVSIPWQIRIQIAVDIASAMTYLHSRKIMHRDLKSKNLLVGDNWKIKICDFGFARSVHDKKKTAALTFCGTEEYMAPEVIFGMEYDERAEVYSYGLLLCEIMTRQKVEETVPRTSNTNYGLDHQEFTTHVPRDCPIELLQLAYLCTEYEPKNRPEFREITQILREIKQNFHVTSPVITPARAPAPTQHATAQQAPPAHTAPAPAPTQHATAHQAPAHTTTANVPPSPAPGPTPTPSPAQPSLPPAPAIPVVLPLQLPPPFSLDEDLHQGFEDVQLSPPPKDKAPPPLEKPQNQNHQTQAQAQNQNHQTQNQNGNKANTTTAAAAPEKPAGSSPPTPHRKPAAVMRRSPSAPIPMPDIAKVAPSGKPSAKEPPAKNPARRDLPGPSKLGKPAATPSTPAATPAKPSAAGSKGAPSSRAEEILAKPPAPLTRTSSSSTFPTPKPVASQAAKPPPVNTAVTSTARPPRSSPSPSGSPSPSPTPPSSPSPTPPKSGVPVLPKVPPSVTSPSSSPRNVPKDRPTSPLAKPAPPNRVGRPILPSEVAEKKKILT